MTAEVIRITGEETYPLRHAVLRPHQDISECAYPQDNDSLAFHAGCFVDGQLVGVGTIFPESREGGATENAWRIRGMAVSPDKQGQGLGGLVLETLTAYAAQKGAPGEIWCNGRVAVEGFYKRYGFERIGEVFELPQIGLHVVMSRTL